MIHNPNNILTAGVALEEAKRVMIMVHGRGSSARDILSLTQYLNANDMAFVAPQATDGTWYPYSFLQPTERNEPYLSSALTTLEMVRARLQADFNVKTTQLYWLGFSQGACLTLEFLARNPAVYGGIFGLSGGLIGPDTTPRDYPGTFAGTPVVLGCSEPDSHIPKARVLETDTVLTRMGANVLTRIYPNGGHTINEDELSLVNTVLAG
ncbi:alpha/beta hydrolase [Fibrella forsythiae]|uniref:Phospholipase n=1 Tax=Fibrella forsythiae TaxID=2817061 RepID=A0ABS3JJP4_9BACT|nr:phospholipase [Fibrella forsythiae]MBO0950210.1 phospholipase [Fibrella forsythiae]